MYASVCSTKQVEGKGVENLSYIPLKTTTQPCVEEVMGSNSAGDIFSFIHIFCSSYLSIQSTY